MTFVSVLVPSYNHADFIGDAVRSALDALTVADVDGVVQVLDDGSNDHTLEVLAAVDDPRLQVNAQDNAGAHVAFNRLLANARGDFIFLLNSDDLYAPDRIGKILRTFHTAPDAVAVGTWLEVIDTGGAQLAIKEGWRTLPPWPKRPGAGLSDLGDPALALLETNFLSTTSNIAFRGSVLLDRPPRFEDLRYCHDWDFFLQLCRRGPLLLLDEPLVSYRVHPTNTLKETEADGTARMRFEILWLLARHARALLTSVEPQRDFDRRDLDQRLWRSTPHFGAESLLLQLLALANDPPAFEALLDLDHPFRCAAELALREAAG
ncbi:MAG: glycosyltransferase [Acidobacteriota bacterium]